MAPPETAPKIMDKSQDPEAAETAITTDIPAVDPSTACSACGQVHVQSGRRKADYGDFSEYEVRRLVAEYCMSVTLGSTGWGVPFKVWLEIHGIARHDKMHRLIRLPNVRPLAPADTQTPTQNGHS